MTTFAENSYIEVSRSVGRVDVGDTGVVTLGSLPASASFVTVEVVKSVVLVGTEGDRMTLSFVTPDILDASIAISFVDRAATSQGAIKAEAMALERKVYAVEVLP